MKIFPDNWTQVFLPELPLMELIIRGLLLYFFILFMLRLLPRRTTGKLGAMDLVFILLLTEAASHSLGDFNSLGDGIIMLLVFMLCNLLVNQLSFRTHFFQKLFEHDPVQIIRDGKLLHRNMKKELLNKTELLAHLREKGIDDLALVKSAFVEGEGNISVVKWDEKTE